MPRHRPPPLAAHPAVLLTAAARALLGPGRCWWPAAAAVAFGELACGLAPAPVAFAVRTVLAGWLLAVVSVVVAERAAGANTTLRLAIGALRGRLLALAALSVAVRVASDALTPVGVGLLLSAGWAVALPAAAVERLGFAEALRTSWTLTRGSLLQVGAIRLSAVLAGWAATELAGWLAGALTGRTVATLAAATLLGPFPLVVQALLYVEARGTPIRDFSVSIAETGVGSTPSPSARYTDA